MKRKIRYYNRIEYGGYIIQSFSTKACNKRDFIIFDHEENKVHAGQFHNINHAQWYIDERLNGGKE